MRSRLGRWRSFYGLEENPLPYDTNVSDNPKNVITQMQLKGENCEK